MTFRPEFREGLPPNTGSSPRHPTAEESRAAQATSSSSAPAPHELQAALPALLTFSSLLEELRSRKVELAKRGADAAHIRSEVLQFIAERALAISGASGIAIALAEGNDIVCRGTAGDTAPPLGLKLDLRSGLTAICYTTGIIVRCDDSESDTRVDHEACRQLGVRSVVAAPLRTPDGTCGLIEAFEKQAYAFTDGDIRELSLLAELTVEAIRPEATPTQQAPPAPLVQALEPSSPKIPAPKINDLAGQNTSLGDWTQLTGSARDIPALAPSVASRQQSVSPVVPASGRRQQASYRPAEPAQPWRIRALLAVGVVAVAGAAWSWHSPKVEPTPPVVAAPAASTPPSLQLSPAQVAENSALPRITGLRHWANSESSTVVIDLQDAVPYEIHKLSSPDRIYVDLHDTALVKELADKNDVVDDALLSRIKIGQTVPGVSRVELETKDSSNFSVSLEPNPFRLVLEIRSLQAPPKPKMDTQTAWQNTTHPAFPEISKNPTAEDTRMRAHVPHLRIVVDAGHGGWDMGTVGRQGLLEKDLALEIAQRLGVLLEQRLGMEVIYTRSDDTFVSLGRRAAIANQVGADLFVSVHANYSSESEARGVETYYTSSGPSTQVLAEEEKEVGTAPALQMDASELRGKSEASRKLAASVQQALYGSLASKSPGVRNRGVKAASFVVLTGTTMPAILAEVSFVSSPTDEHNLQDPFYRQNIAEALYRGVARYAVGSGKTNVASANKHSTGL
jgi:N-acetylmuramoyl-L-alanine amidase